MKLKPIALIILAIYCSINAFGQYKYVQKLGNLGSVNLPDTPKVTDKTGNQIYVTRYHNVVFLANIGDVSPGLKDLFKKESVDSIYSGYIIGLLRSTKGKVFYRDRIVINGHYGLELGYKAIIKGQPVFSYFHIVSLENKILACAIMASDSLSKDDANLAGFFKGFKVKDDVQLSHESTAAMAYKTGTVIGILLVIGFAVLLVLGVIFGVRKLASVVGREK